jgi:tetratricopeptide (TPR) repeat protein
LNPNNATAHQFFAIHLSAMGRFDEALREITLALELDPASIPINSALGLILYRIRQYERARRQLQKVLAAAPEFTHAREHLGRVYIEAGLYDQAISEFEKIRDASMGHSVYSALLAHAYARAGKRRQARGLLKHLSENAGQSYISPYHLAAVHTALGEVSHAFEWLRQGLEEHCLSMGLLKVDPHFDLLRTNARFRRLLRQVNLAA